MACDRDKARLQLFTLDGKFVNSIEGQHIGLSAPYSVAVSSSGQLFVTSSLEMQILCVCFPVTNRFSGTD